MAERAHPDDPGFQDAPGRPSVYRKKLFERYEFCNQFVGGQRVLDIPCGTGWGTSLLAGCRMVTGVDIAQDAIDFAQKRFGKHNAVFMPGSMTAIPKSDDSVDVVICLEGFEHVARDVGAAFLAECRRVLVRGGLLIMTCPVLNEQGATTGNPYHCVEYPEEELIDLLNRAFRIRQLERIAGPEGPEYRVVAENFKGSRYAAGVKPQ